MSHAVLESIASQTALRDLVIVFNGGVLHSKKMVELKNIASLSLASEHNCYNAAMRPMDLKIVCPNLKELKYVGLVEIFY